MHSGRLLEEAGTNSASLSGGAATESASPLRGCRILVVEDEYLLAEELRVALIDVGAIVLGPAGLIDEALEFVVSGEPIDGAVLDINLCGDMVFPVADRLAERGVPFIFATGYDGSVVPPRFAQIARCEKPVRIQTVVAAIDRSVHPD